MPLRFISCFISFTINLNLLLTAYCELYEFGIQEPDLQGPLIIDDEA